MNVARVHRAPSKNVSAQWWQSAAIVCEIILLFFSQRRNGATAQPLTWVKYCAVAALREKFFRSIVNDSGSLLAQRRIN